MPRGKKKIINKTDKILPPLPSDSAVEQTEESGNEEMSEAEVNKMFEAKEAAPVKKANGSTDVPVDPRFFDANDPERDLKDRKTWVAVFECPKTHKTKATNHQANSGVYCWKCREEGVLVKATIMEQFLTPPPPPVDDSWRNRKGVTNE